MDKKQFLKKRERRLRLNFLTIRKDIELGLDYAPPVKFKLVESSTIEQRTDHFVVMPSCG